MDAPGTDHGEGGTPPPRPVLGRNVLALSAVSFFTDVASEMIYPLLPLFLSSVLGASALGVGAVEGAADSTSALLRLASGWWSDRLRRRKPLVVAGYAIASFVRPVIAATQSVPQVLGIRIADRIGKGLRSAPRDALIADSVDPSVRGRAFGFHRAADHAGAVVGPLIAFCALRWAHVSLRQLFWLAIIPGVMAMIVVVAAVGERPRGSASRGVPGEGDARGAVHGDAPGAPPARLPDRRLWTFLTVVLLFALGNSSDAFLLLRATQLGIAAALLPILWAALHVVKSASSTPGGALSDRIGRKPLIVGGWLLYAAVYAGLGFATAAWEVWILFAVYGLYFGMTEGVEKALVADVVGAERRGAGFGWYYLVIGIGALPASLIFGAIWDRAGAPTAFFFGAAMALVAAAGLAVVAPGGRGGRGIAPSIRRPATGRSTGGAPA